MKRITTAWMTCLKLSVTGVLLLSACKGKSGHGGHGQASDIQFSVDTSQIRHMDSVAALQRRSDSELLRKADSTPGINEGAGNFDIRTPSGWQRTDTLMGTIKAVLLSTPSPSIRFRTNVNVVSESMHGLTLDQYEQLTINNMAKYIHQFALVGQGERTIGDLHARWLHYSQSPEGTDLENICYIIPYKGVAYIITCSALKGHLLQGRGAFEQAISSFRIRH
jgi:hypothetical protein